VRHLWVPLGPIKMKKAKSDLTAESLRGSLAYDPATGEFRWKMSTPSRREGQEAGSINGGGYRVIGIGGRLYYAHRLAWLYMTGSWPENLIDHVDMVCSNNRWDNLRSATVSENLCNRGAPKNNTSGLKGVSKRSEGWGAFIAMDGSHKSLGLYPTKEAAHEAYCREAERLHGEFARYKPSAM
jgi:hypothetical protein